MNNIPVQQNEEQIERPGIGGGLSLLAAVLLLLLPVNLLAYYKTDILSFFTGGFFFSVMWSMSPVWSILLLVELIALPAAIVSSLVLVVLLFKKHAIVPKAVIVLFVTLAVLALLDYGANHFLAQYAEGPMRDSIELRILKHMSKMLLYSVIFIPYLLFSGRVKETFRR